MYQGFLAALMMIDEMKTADDETPIVHVMTTTYAIASTIAYAPHSIALTFHNAARSARSRSRCS